LHTLQYSAYVVFCLVLSTAKKQLSRFFAWSDCIVADLNYLVYNSQDPLQGLPKEAGEATRISIALKPNPLTGELRIAGRAVDENGNSAGSTWRNGGVGGNSPTALEVQPGCDTDLLELVFGFIGDGSAYPVSITPDVLILRTKKLHLPKLAYDMYNFLQQGSAEVRHVGMGEVPKTL
jgi:hypothetical protein